MLQGESGRGKPGPLLNAQIVGNGNARKDGQDGDYHQNFQYGKPLCPFITFILSQAALIMPFCLFLCLEKCPASSGQKDSRDFQSKE